MVFRGRSVTGPQSARPHGTTRSAVRYPAPTLLPGPRSGRPLHRPRAVQQVVDGVEARITSARHRIDRHQPAEQPPSRTLPRYSSPCSSTRIVCDASRAWHREIPVPHPRGLPPAQGGRAAWDRPGIGNVGLMQVYSGITFRTRLRPRLMACGARVIWVMPARWSRRMAMFRRTAMTGGVRFPS